MQYRRKTVKDSTKNQIKGKTHEVKGAIKEKAGHATDNPALENEGNYEKVAESSRRKSERSRKPPDRKARWPGKAKPS